MTLYEINEQIRLVLEYGVDHETGEMDEASWQALDELQMARDEKLEAIGLFIKNLSAEAEAIKAEADALKLRATRKANRAERLREYLRDALVYEGLQKFETAKVAYTLRKVRKVEITNEEALPECFRREKITVEPDKVAIKAAIKAGEVVEGAELVESQSLTIK